MNQQFIGCIPQNNRWNYTRLAGSSTPMGAGTGAGTLAAHTSATDTLPPTGGRDLGYHEGGT